jgi:hypothetical protein
METLSLVTPRRFLGIMHPSMLRAIIVCILLAGATLAAYWPATSYGFIDLDDLYNIKTNANVTNGLTANSFTWAFTTDYADYWHPLTWISFMIDADVWGNSNSPDQAESEAAQRGYHITNIALHIINTLLLLGVLTTMTVPTSGGGFWRSAVVAGWFALHPMHVESVVWVTERKDVLSMTFWLLTMWAYTRHVRSTSTARSAFWYALTAGFLALGLMSKPIVVTLPCVLLLMDFWPLKRIQWPATRKDVREFLSDVRGLAIEKLPLFALAAVSASITFLHGSRSVWHLDLSERLINAIAAYARYLGKSFWPVDLCVYYAYPGKFGTPPWTVGQIAFFSLLLGTITLYAFATVRKRPSTLVGWLWFVGTLVPVIGLVQVAFQSMADRFTYFPHLGLFIAVAWLAADLSAQWRIPRAVPAVLAIITMAACGWLTSQQVRTWQDSETLYRHALAISPHMKVHLYLGDYLYGRKQLAPAIEQFDAAIAMDATHPDGWFKRGVALAYLEQDTEAIASFNTSLELDPNQGQAHRNLAIIYSFNGRFDEARQHLREARRLQPEKRAEDDAIERQIEEQRRSTK